MKDMPFRHIFVIARDCHIGSQNAHILENATMDELYKRVKEIVEAERQSDLANGWKSRIICNEEGLDYTVITKTPTGNTFKTRISVMEVVSLKRGTREKE